MTAPAYPLAAYRFHVVVGDQSMSFAEVTGLAVGNETFPYVDGMSFSLGSTIAVVPSRSWVPVTLRRGTVAGLTTLSDWLADRSPRRLQVSLRDADAVPRVTWTADRAVPVTLTAPAFDAATNEVAVETLELLATGIRVEHQ